MAAAAASNGLDFVVVTDHNVKPSPAERRHGVLIVYGEERSLPDGHLVALAGSAGELHFWAHPLNRRVPWRDFSAPADGMEIISADDMWREALRPPFRRLGLALLDAPQSMLGATYDLLRRPRESLAVFDRLRTARPSFRALCSVDAHGIPPYPVAFATVQLHLPGLVLGGEASRDALAVGDALAAGPLYCGLDGATDASGLQFRTISEGTELEPPPEWSALGVTAKLDCRGGARDGGSLPVVVPSGCRAELQLPWLARRWPESGGSWIYTDPL
ncbi:MAG: PHP domain-containing protein [Deltaproteobacteria bacterium]